MPAYIIGTIRVRDPEAWKAYVARVGATFAPFNGHVIFRGRKQAALSGAGHGERVVVAAFPDLDSLDRWHESPEYGSRGSCRGISVSPFSSISRSCG